MLLLSTSMSSNARQTGIYPSMEINFPKTKIDKILESLETSIEGLTAEKVRQKQASDGANEIKSEHTSLTKILFQQYANFLMLLLIFGAALSIYLGEYVDGLVIVGVLLINGILGTIQEYKAEKLTKALNAHIPQKVNVRREGKEVIIERKDLIRGDIVILTNGQLVPADLRIIKNFGVIVDEAMLTGEAMGVVKQVEELAEDPKSITEMTNMMFSGTFILEGGCEAVVVATGEITEFGKIISFTHHTKKRSSFLQQVNGLSNFLFKTTLLVSGVLFIALALFKPALGINHIFLFTIVLAIAIVPEMLPLISTIALTRASLVLIKNGVLIKRLSSLEDLGGVEIICTDKTGTITKNVLSISNIIAANAEECLRYALYCSKEIKDENFILAGSFDAAIWKKAKRDIKLGNWQTIWQGSFDPHFRWQFTVVEADNEPLIAIKGSPESIVERCQLEDKEKDEILLQSSNFGKEGLRVLAVATKQIKLKANYAESDISRLVFLGLLVFEDPIKDTAAASLKQAENLGVKIKILTGDAPEVALQVAKKAGMKVADNEIITGYDLAQISPEKKITIVHQAKIFARVDPKEKFEIIQILGKRHSVMFLGEGINDAPALKSADVGMVVQEASDIAKEAADIVLTKPDLRVIIQSIYLGRQIMNNIAKYILITLTGNFGSLYAISLLSVISPILPLLPTQVLLENILTDVPMVGLINSPISELERLEPARQNIREICFNAIVFGFATLIIQFIFYRMFSSLPTDLFRTLWLTEIILFEFTLIISLRTYDWFWKAAKLAANTRAFFITVVIFTLSLPYIPLLNSWFHLEPYGLAYLLPIFLVIAFGLLMIEVMKKFIFRHNRIVFSTIDN